MRFIILLALAIGILGGPPPADAEDVFDRLSNEPVSMLDFGIKRLRGMAQQATRRIVLTSDPAAQTSVDFDAAKREVRILFVMKVRQDMLNQDTCRERRLSALKEVFALDAANFSGPISTEQLVIYRLGRMFTREPADKRDSVQAMGERMAESMMLQINLYDLSGNNPIICGGRVTNLKGITN